MESRSAGQKSSSTIILLEHQFYQKVILTKISNYLDMTHCNSSNKKLSYVFSQPNTCWQQAYADVDTMMQEIVIRTGASST